MDRDRPSIEPLVAERWSLPPGQSLFFLALAALALGWHALEFQGKTPHSLPQRTPGGSVAITARPDVLKTTSEHPVVLFAGSQNGMPWRVEYYEPFRGKLALNTADQSALETLPGIGPVMAGRIIERRERLGPYRTWQDLDEVQGIGPKTLARLQPLVTLGP